MNGPDDELSNSDDTYDKPIYFFGKDVRKIRCFRDSFFFGIYSGFGSGLASFMWTSKVRSSISTGLCFLWMGIFLYWIPCRYKYESSVLMAEALKAKVKQHAEEKKKMKEENS